MGYKEPKPGDFPKNKWCVICMNYAGHWILGSLQYWQPRMAVYDSLRGYAHDMRAIELLLIEDMEEAAWKKRVPHQLKACDQQDPGSNDCGVFTINNALRLGGVEMQVSRRTLQTTCNLRLAAKEDFAVGSDMKDQDPEEFARQHPEWRRRP